MKSCRSASLIGPRSRAAATAGDEVAAGRRPGRPGLRLRRSGSQVGGHGRAAGGEVLVELQRAHRFGQRRAPVRDQAGVGGVGQRGHLLARDRRPAGDVRLGQQRREVGAVGERADQDQRAVGPGAGDGAHGLDVEPRVEGADVEQARAGQRRRTSPAAAPAAATASGSTPLGTTAAGPRGADPLDDRGADRADPAAAGGDPLDRRPGRLVAPALVVGVGGKVVGREEGDRARPVELGEGGDEAAAR